MRAPGTHIPPKLEVLDVETHSGEITIIDAAVPKHKVPEHLSHGGAIGGCLKH